MLTLMRKQPWIAALLLVSMPLAGCSSTEVAPDKSVMPEVPDYVKVPHPVGYEIAEIRALFENPLAPKNGLRSFTDQCDNEFQQLMKATQAKVERHQGASELVTRSAEKMHWCFYGKVERMQENLKSEQSWTARQKIVLDAYEFLTPIANAFLTIYHDSRYMRWATQYYSNISESIFFRKVVPGPENTLALTTSTSTDLETWTMTQQNGEKKPSVFARYGIALDQETKDASEPTPAVRAPAEAVPPTAPAEAEPILDPVVNAPEPDPVPTAVKSTAVDPLQIKPTFTHQIPDAPLAPIGGKAAPVPPIAEAPAVAKPVATQPAPAKQVPVKRVPAKQAEPAPENVETPFGL